MSKSTSIRFIQQRQDSLASISLRLFALIIFVSLFAASPESVKAVSCYSDLWIDDSAAEDVDDVGTVSIVGCGVTSFGYYEPYHDAIVETTITSPNGRSSTAIADDNAGGYKQSFNARAEALLAWDWNDMGDYIVNSRHYSECPITEFGFTGFVLGTNLHAYQLDPRTTDEYLSTCRGRCTISPMRNPLLAPAPFLQCGSDNGCNVSLCSAQTVPGRCTGYP
ncbi:MAG: hypothetical protein ABR577_07690 [Pyrinomonadaceae bacterium]